MTLSLCAVAHARSKVRSTTSSEAPRSRLEDEVCAPGTPVEAARASLDVAAERMSTTLYPTSEAVRPAVKVCSSTWFPHHNTRTHTTCTDTHASAPSCQHVPPGERVRNTRLCIAGARFTTGHANTRTVCAHKRQQHTTHARETPRTLRPSCATRSASVWASNWMRHRACQGTCAASTSST